MPESSILAFLAHRFPTGRENLATEAFYYLLRESPEARRALAELVWPLGLDIPSGVTYQTQVSSDENGIPDLIGSIDSSDPYLIIESKFWAGLTSRQPNSYLELLRRREQSALLFIAPRRRMESLWPELLRRVQESHPGDIPEGSSENLRWLHVDSHRSLGLTNWAFVLGTVRQSLERSDNHHLIADLDQLIALCNQADGEGFEPISDEELASSHGRRIMQYCELVDDVVSNLRDTPRMNVLRASGGMGYYNRTLSAFGWRCILRFSGKRWGQFTDTPIWFQVKDHENMSSVHVAAALRSLQVSNPRRLFHDDTDGSFHVPIFVPANCDRDVVLARMVDQVQGVVQLIENYVTEHPEVGSTSEPSDTDTTSDDGDIDSD